VNEKNEKCKMALVTCGTLKGYGMQLENQKKRSDMAEKILKETMPQIFPNSVGDINLKT
jgi:hypothetical protein